MKKTLLLLCTALIIITAGTSCKKENKNPKVKMTTELGDIVFEIFEKEAPVSSANFMEYIEKEMFKGTHFYRVVNMQNQPNNDMKIEVIQGGLGWNDTIPRLKSITHETTKETGILHLTGTLSMARNKPGSADSEFFICVNNQPELDYGGKRNTDGQGFAAFGKVIKGMEVVKKIHKLPNKNQMLDKTVLILDIEKI